jgi:hypothetical protein
MPRVVVNVLWWAALGWMLPVHLHATLQILLFCDVATRLCVRITQVWNST